MAFKSGVYRLHAVTLQLIHRTFELAGADKDHIIPDFIDAEWVVNTEEEYIAMIAEVEHRVNTHFSEKWARREHGISARLEY